MSRLIVKNLPPNVTEDKLLKTFSSHGLVSIAYHLQPNDIFMFILLLHSFMLGIPQDYLTNINFKISSWMFSISSCLHRSSPLKFENRILIRSLQVTNVQLKYTREGKFRHFGFVGFKTDDDAKNAQKYFNGTFIGSSKISVEVCADLGDESKPRQTFNFESFDFYFRRFRQFLTLSLLQKWNPRAHQSKICYNYCHLYF